MQQQLNLYYLKKKKKNQQNTVNLIKQKNYFKFNKNKTVGI